VSKGWLTISTSPTTETTQSDETAWPIRYLRDHMVHTAVFVLFAAYPGIHHLLVTSPLHAEVVALLPDIETMVLVVAFGLFAMSFDFISGYTGYLSFGHAAFYGTGAYFVILVANGKVPFIVSDTPFMISLLLGGAIAVLLAVAVGAVSFRLTGVYFAMITLGFAQVFYVFIRGWEYLGANPRGGITVLDHPGFKIGVPYIDQLNLTIGLLAGDEVMNLFGFIDLSAVEVSYYMIGIVVLLCYFAMQRILHSPFGRVMVAIRENEERTEAIGYNTFRYKLGAFAISAFFAAIAGGLFAGYQRSVAPENTFYFLVTGDALLAAIIGGLGTLAGPLYGRLFHETVREFLSKTGEGGGLLPYLREHLSDTILNTEVFGLTVEQAIEVFLNGHASLYIGILFVLFVLYVPDGLLGRVRDRFGGRVAKRVADRIDRYRR
jgi:branched-chain amino acid transport system permease protein